MIVAKVVIKRFLPGIGKLIYNIDLYSTCSSSVVVVLFISSRNEIQNTLNQNKKKKIKKILRLSVFNF